MNLSQMDEARHARERGAILEVLKQGYDQSMVSVASLSGALNMAGMPMTAAGLQFSLTLLADSGYILIWRAKETPAWRPDRMNEMRPDTIVFAKLTPKGLFLIDGHVASDPAVIFG